MERTKHSKLIMIAGVLLSAVLWLLDSVVDYATASEGLSFLEMVFSPPLHAVFARSMLVVTILAVSWASSTVIGVLEGRRRLIEHLNSVLRSIRSINQLLVQERNADELLDRACELLIEGRGYPVAWIILRNEGHEVSAVFVHGLGEEAEIFVEAVGEGGLSPCMDRVAQQGAALVIPPGVEERADCVLSHVHAENAAILAPLRFGERVEGYLGVFLPPELASRDEELDLVEEIAGDLAMGLHAIEVEAELEQHTALLAEAERLASLGAWRWDLEADALHFTEQWGRIHGVEGERLPREELMEVAHPADSEAVAAALDAVLKGEAAYAIEHRIIRQTDGAIRWIDAHGEAIRDPDGEIVAFYGAAQDITERKRAEERLRESRAELAAIYANAPVVMMLVDGDRRVRKINGFAARIVGRPEDALVGLRGGEAIQCLHHLDDPRGCGFGDACEECAVRDTVLDTFDTGEGHHQVEATLPIQVDGTTTEMTFLVSTARLDHRDEPVVLVTMEDITERKRAEQEVRELSRFREAIIDQANTAVVVFSPEGSVIVANRAVQEMTGYTSEDVKGRDAWGKALCDEQAVAETWQKLQAVVRDGEAVRDFETRIRAADGTERLVSWDARRLSDEEGASLGAVAMGRDVTEQRELERRLARSQRMEAIGRLAGGVAHDFNNMLTAIIGNANLLETEVSDPGIRKRLADIRQAGERSASLTRQLLTFSRRAHTEPTIFDLNDVVADMQSMLDRLTREHTAVEVALCEDRLPVRADRSQIEQMVMNLAVNARDAMPDGGTIRIATSLEAIDGDRAAISGVDPGDYAFMRVIDSGAGMDPETQARAFEPFFTTREEGTGLGLATVYGIVQGAQGEIEIDSAPGDGTTVRVWLPLTEEPAPESAGAARKGRAADRGEARVLLAEDEDQVRGLITSIMQQAGYEVIEAESGEAALELFEQQKRPIDMLLTDVVMDGMGGVELAERLREQQPGLPTLFISGYTELSLPAGARLLSKPFMPDELLETVRQVLG